MNYKQKTYSWEGILIRKYLKFQEIFWTIPAPFALGKLLPKNGIVISIMHDKIYYSSEENCKSKNLMPII